MRIFITTVSLAAFATVGAAQGIFCEPTGNVAIFSNYDGGNLVINVDQNIPDLYIGIVSYEFSRITITGPYAGNVDAVWYVGYNASNDHCSLGSALFTTISGVPASVDSILLYPPATYANPNGYGSIICNYSCDISTSQGGCNTADQIAHYFLTQWGGTLLFHFTQYGCWGNGYNISGGGNCCANPLATSIAEDNTHAEPLLLGDRLILGPGGNCEVIDAAGRVMLAVPASATQRSIDVGLLPTGTYSVRDRSRSGAWRFAIFR